MRRRIKFDRLCGDNGFSKMNPLRQRLELGLCLQFDQNKDGCQVNLCPSENKKGYKSVFSDEDQDFSIAAAFLGLGPAGFSHTLDVTHRLQHRV